LKKDILNEINYDNLIDNFVSKKLKKNSNKNIIILIILLI